jgi:hypothetical protein
MRQVLKRVGVNWQRAKRWITSPDCQYALKKGAQLPDAPDRPTCGLGAGLCR